MIQTLMILWGVSAGLLAAALVISKIAERLNTPPHAVPLEVHVAIALEIVRDAPLSTDELLWKDEMQEGKP